MNGSSLYFSEFINFIPIPIAEVKIWLRNIRKVQALIASCTIR